jgi:ABC-type multidrug transport system ATPase subunit
LVKSYGALRAVDGVSFQVAKGELYGLLGPNGAGKTTIMSMLSGLLAPDEGRILFDGVDLAAEPLGSRRSWASCRRSPHSTKTSRLARTSISGGDSTGCPALNSRRRWIACSIPSV